MISNDLSPGWPTEKEIILLISPPPFVARAPKLVQTASFLLRALPPSLPLDKEFRPSRVEEEGGICGKIRNLLSAFLAGGAGQVGRFFGKWRLSAQP